MQDIKFEITNPALNAMGAWSVLLMWGDEDISDPRQARRAMAELFAADHGADLAIEHESDGGFWLVELPAWASLKLIEEGHLLVQLDPADGPMLEAEIP